MGHSVTVDARASAPAGGNVVVAFANAGDYGAWHDAKCREVGIPVQGRNTETDEDAGVWTTAFVAPWLVDGYVCVSLPADVIAADATLKSLEVLTVKYPAAPGSDVDVDGNPISEITIPAPGVPYEQPIPD